LCLQNQLIRLVSIAHEPPNRLVSDIFSIKVADTQTDRHTDTSTDNKGRLKLSSRASQYISPAEMLRFVIICNM